MKAKALLGMALWLVASTAFGQALWRDIPVGSTVEQTQKKFPAAVAPADTSAPQPGEAAPLLELGGFLLAEKPFKARFYFKAGKLEKVILSQAEPLPGAEGMLVASKIRDGLTVKYGTPIEDQNKADRLSTLHTTSWFKAGTKINLIFMQIGDFPSDVSVVYLGPEDTSNL